MYASHAVNPQIVGCVVGGLMVVTLAIKYGMPGWTKLDKFCLIGAAVGVLLWAIFRDPLFGIIVPLGVASLGTVPTVVSAWEDPSRENKTGWTLFWASSVLAVIAIPEWTLQDSAQPVTFLILNSVMQYVLRLRK